MQESKLDSGRLVQGLILFGFTAYLIKLLATGEVNNLLSPLAANLLLVTAGVMGVMTAYCLITMFKRETGHEHHHHHEHAATHDHAHDHDTTIITRDAVTIMGMTMTTTQAAIMTMTMTMTTMRAATTIMTTTTTQGCNHDHGHDHHTCTLRPRS